MISVEAVWRTVFITRRWLRLTTWRSAICDVDGERLRTTADRYGVEGRYSDYRQMVEEVAPDAVYVIGPPHIMFDIWTWCLGQGLNLYVEKPLGITIHQARLGLSDRPERLPSPSQLQAQVLPDVSASARCLKRGPIVHAECSFYKYDINPYLQARDHMMDDGVHAIDTLRWMCGGEVVAIHSVTKRVQTPDINFISTLMEFDNGATGVMLNSWSSGRRIFKVEMHAPGICVEAEHENKGRLYAEGDTEGVEYDTRAVAGSDELYVYGGFQAKTREFIDALKSGVQPQSCFADALKTMEVAERILAQALLED